MAIRPVLLLVGLIWLGASHLAEARPGASPSGGHNNKALPKFFDYGTYVERFRKAYNPIEALNYARLFFARSLKIFKHNLLYKEGKVGYYLSQNQFTDKPLQELNATLFRTRIDMEPIAEAKTRPNSPAMLEGSSIEADNLKDGFSQASLVRNNAKVDKRTQQVKPLLSFVEDEKLGDLSWTLDGASSSRDHIKGAVELGEPVERGGALSSSPNYDQDDRDGAKGKLAGGHEGVMHKARIKSDNKNYEPPMVQSRGFADNVGSFLENYASYISDHAMVWQEEESDLNKLNAGQDDEEEEEEESWLEKDVSEAFSSLITSIKYYFVENESGATNTVNAAGGEIKRQEDQANEGRGTTKDRALERAKPEVVVDAEIAIDWRESGCITEPRSQLDCNSCYAFATLSLMEFFHCRQTKQLTEFSPQYVVDCGSYVNLNGCEGGRLSGVGQFIKRYGVELNSNYGYHGRKAECPYGHDVALGPGATRMGYLRPQISKWQTFQSIDAWSKWLTLSPVLVGVNMPSDFLAYGGGVHDGLDCLNGMPHAMLLVGSGVEEGKRFWLLKNSFASSWGEAGYFRLSKEAPARCFYSATVIRVNYTSAEATSGY